MHSKKAIGIFGGTFDPIHFGHLRTAIELQQTLGLAEIRFIPCYQPVHRELPIASPDDRFKMVCSAIQDEPLFQADDCEIRRNKPSYMIDTLEELQQKFTSTPLCLIMGIDAFLGFLQWHRFDQILRLANLVVVHRPQHSLPSVGPIAELIKQHLKSDLNTVHQIPSGNIILQPVTPLEISATDIRQQFANGKNPRYLLPESVYKYIQQHGVYPVCHI